VAIADPYPENLERARRAFDAPAAFADPLEMLAAADMDAVVVAAPHAHHHEIALHAIRGGRHVLVEKPFVLEPAHGRELIDAAVGQGVEIVVGYPWHFNRQSLAARRWIEDGELGALTYVGSFFGSSAVDLYRGHPDAYAEYGTGESFFGPRPATYSEPDLAGGGQGQTQMTHSLALLLFLTGLVPTRVTALMASLDAPVDVIDALAIKFEGGAIGSASSTGAVTPLEHTELLEYRIHGSRGHVQFDVMDGRLTLWTSDGSTDAPEVPPEERYPLRSPATNLIDVALGRAENGSDATIAQLTVELLHAAYRSAGSDGAAMDVGSRA
jgi:predicted dehydrogenase